MPGVLVVEGDVVFGSRIVRALTIAGFHPLLAKNAANALCLAKRAEPESFLIAWHLAQPTNGLTLTRRLRKLTMSADRPIVLMSGIMKTPEDEANALKAGADLFWIKDITRSDELFQHIRALQLMRPAARDIRLENICLKPEKRILEVDGKKTSPLRGKEAGVLALLMKRPGAVLPDDFLWDSVWGGEEERPKRWKHNLHSTISRLRKKLPSGWGERLKVSKELGYSLDMD